MRKLLVVLSLVLLWTATATAQDIPDRRRRAVVDEANVIAGPQEQQLNQRIVNWNRTTGHQLVVATIPDLQGLDIADYANTLLRTWGIGRAGANDGVILLLAPTERQVRIEVGYGLEAVLTDALSSQIIEETIQPGLRNGDVGGALSAGADRIMASATMDPADAAALTLAAERAPERSGSYLWLVLLIGIPAVLIVGVVAIVVYEERRGRRIDRENKAWREQDRRNAPKREQQRRSRQKSRWQKLLAEGKTEFTDFENFYADFLRREKEKEKQARELSRWNAERRASSTAATTSPNSSWWSSSEDSGWSDSSSGSDSGFDSGGGSGGGGGADSNY